MTQVRHTFSFTFDEAFVKRALRRDRNWAVAKVLILYALLTPVVVFGMRPDGTLVYGILGGGFLATYAFANLGGFSESDKKED